LTTPQGRSLIIIVGCGVGFLFAVVALCVSVVSFPLMLDRHASAIDAIRTSLRAVMKNPFAMAAWGLIVAVLLVIGSLPFFVGLAVVLPVLGQSTDNRPIQSKNRTRNVPILKSSAIFTSTLTYSPMKNKAAVALGRRGGKAKNAKLPPEQRKAIMAEVRKGKGVHPKIHTLYWR
jgi:hypothetical protein